MFLYFVGIKGVSVVENMRVIMSGNEYCMLPAMLR